LTVELDSRHPLLPKAGWGKWRFDWFSKRNETDRNETKRNETTLYFVSFRFDRFRFVLFDFVSEWELLKNVEIRKSIYAHITNTRFVDPPFENFAYIKTNHIFSLMFNKIMFIWYEIPVPGRFVPNPVQFSITFNNSFLPFQNPYPSIFATFYPFPEIFTSFPFPPNRANSSFYPPTYFTSTYISNSAYGLVSGEVCNNCKVLKLRHDTARQLRICDEQFWDLRVPTDGGDTELPDYRLKWKFYRLKCKLYRLKCKIYRLKCKIYRLKCEFYRLKCEKW
jgi:hypothetical protein